MLQRTEKNQLLDDNLKTYEMKIFFYTRFLLLICLFVLPTQEVCSQTNIVKRGAKYDTIIRKHVTRPPIKQLAKPEIVLPVPEFINQPYYYDSNRNALIKLENATAVLNTKKKTLGLKGSKQFLSMADPSSKIRFTSQKGIVFLIKTSGDVIDLTSYIKLYKFIPGDQKREVTITAKDGVLTDKEETKGKQISFSIKPVSKDNYEILLPDELEAGEYGFVWVKNMDLKEFSVFAFGIDWKSSN